MGDDRIGAGVKSGISGFVPRVYIRQVEIGAARVDKEGGDHTPSLFSLGWRDLCFSIAQ
jgi:hypothetical protein